MFQQKWAHMVNFLRYIVSRFYRDACTSRAAALTFTSLLGLVPLLTLSLAILSMLPSFANLSQQVEQFLLRHFLSENSQQIANYLQQFVLQARHLSFGGAIFLIATAILMLRTMEKTFNAIWQVEQQRSGLSSFVVYWAVLSLLPILIGLSIAVSSYLFSIPLIHDTTQHVKPILRLIPLLISFLAFTLLYRALPNCWVPFKAASIAGLFTAVCFEFAKRGFSLYVSHFPSYQVIYGALSAVPLFLVWLYVFWLIILCGAVLSNVLAWPRQYQQGHTLDGFSHAVLWLGFLWQAQANGQSLSVRDLLQQSACRFRVSPQQQLAALQRANLITNVGHGHYMLSRDLQRVSLFDLYQALPWQLPLQQTLKLPQPLWQQQLQNLMTSLTIALTANMNQAVATLFSED